MTEHNVIAVSFENRANAFQALSELKGATFEGRLDVLAANVVLRDENGRIEIPEGINTVGGNGAWGGGLIGLLVGVLGGPIGMLFGWTGGLLIGGAVDARRVDRTETALGALSSSIPDGGTALVAEVVEYAREVVDGEMAKLGGVVFRRPAEEVLSDVEAAEDAYEQARAAADHRLGEQKRAERRARFEQRRDALKEKLSIG